MSCPANRLRWLSLAIRVYGAKWAHSRFRTVGYRKGGKRLLNTSAGLVRRLFATSMVVGFPKRTDDHSEFSSRRSNTIPPHKSGKARIA
jgi:hypothetical protein